jgi:lipopolysaccharide/colanic/teichoic acid biosynthesis glycosyltransferase
VGITPPATGNGQSPRGTRLASRAAVTNLFAQGAALASVSLASLIVARVGGPAIVGEYALIRVLPWLFGVILSCGLPTASAFFVAGDHARDRRLRPTMALMTVIGAGLGVAAWLACAEPFHALFFRQVPLRLVLVIAVLVVTQLGTVTAKGCLQGAHDITGANMVIVAEELWFVFVYPAALLISRDRGVAPVVYALIISGGLAMLTGMIRLLMRRFFTGWGLPSPALARRIAAFGAKGQLGNMLWLTNLRFDFVLLGALAGPAVLGIYAIASKFAELMRLAPTAINYVLYPRFARLGPRQATHEARRLLPRATALTLVLTPVLAVATVVALPLLYGSAFRGAVVPAEIIIIGLSVEGAAAVSSAYLLGCGRPGLNSVGMGVGATITVTMDVILIPRYGALGGAITSAVTYLSSTSVLTYLTYRIARRVTPGHERSGPPAGALGADTGLRRAVDVLIAAAALIVAAPLLLAAAAAVRLSGPGPVLYKQERAGRSGRPFTMFKFRSMVADADRRGPLVTGRHDPRITRVGAWLRASKLDELPQLLNVVRGDMTLIGPRPEVPHFLPCYHPDELVVLRVRPGVTGPGQILYTEVQAGGPAPEAGPAAADPEAHYIRAELHPKLAVDLDYLRRRSLRTDLGVVLRTIAMLCRQGGGAPEAAQKR